MIIIVRFPIRSLVYVQDPWPIKVEDRSYFITTEQGRATHVSVRFTNVPVESAPTFETTTQGGVKGRITNNSSAYILMAEHDLRGWQTMLTGQGLIDIDFDSPNTEFKGETAEEQEKITFHQFGLDKRERRTRGLDEFAIYGRAFLAIQEGHPLIELMSLYRDAHKALKAQRWIDAYNGFYLFLESQFCGGQSATNQVVDKLSKNAEFMRALGRIVEDKEHTKIITKFKSISDWPNHPRVLIKEIVELRGHLRHHNLNSSRRWDPNRQEDYASEAIFLSLVAYGVAFPKTTSKLWNEPYVSEFVRLAKELRMTIEIQVTLTIRREEMIEDMNVKMTLPQPHANPHLAQFVLTKSLEMLEQKSPGAELFAIRARIISTNTELLRYDVGPSLQR